MNTSEPVSQPRDTHGTLTSVDMLAHLIDILIHPNANTNAWLEEMMDPTIGSNGALERIMAFASYAARANVAYSLTHKMVAAIVKAEGWVVTREGIEVQVNFAYRNHLKNKDDERRAKEKQIPSE